MPSNRRDFLRQSAAFAGALSFAAPAVLGADKARKYRTALIGTGWWGMNILTEAVKDGRAQVVALCDVDGNQLSAAADELAVMTSDEPKQYRDFREMFDKEQIEIAIIATPDHWHSLQSIAALKHGAHVYVEKPTGHTIRESRAMVNAARQADRVVQVGMHRRIGPHHVSGMKFLKDPENMGKIGMVKMFVHEGGGPEKPNANAPVPAELDWDLYCGPAPLRPYNRKIHPGGFRHFLDFANGTIGDWGVHWMDQLLWWCDGQQPKSIYSAGGRPIAGPVVLNEQEQTTDSLDHQTAIFEFDNFTATWENQRFGKADADKHPFGCYFIGEKGVFHMGWRDGWTFFPTAAGKPVVHVDPEFDNPADGHNVTLLWQDFMKCIETGQRPVADVEIGHQATNLPLLAMISYKLGRSITWDGQKEQIPGDEEANKLLKRQYRGEWVYPEV
ncbi:Gfo/Idh/MocA family protein [Planctomicrobium sp. SH661]|uniref:Gfo/Idh/MocA family protein n=1 Tax=Planctomicrobium sp. SH661 TaxID=3448124 RepID=UPI003F5BCA6F